MLVLERFLGSYDKERPELINMKKPSEVVVATVEHIKCVWLVWDNIHSVYVIYLGLRDMKDGRNLSLEIKQRMHFDTSFSTSEVSPIIHAQTQVNRGRVKGVDLSMELEDVLYPLLLSDPHHVVGELLEDAIVTTVVRFGQVASGDVLAETEYVELVLERSRCYDETSQ